MSGLAVYEEDSSSLVYDRSTLAASIADGGKPYRYVIKTIQSSVREQAETYIQSAIDLAVEARYLSVLRHPHIIRLRAISSASPFAEGQTFFIIEDKLSDILSRRIKIWKKSMSSSSLLSCCVESEAREFWIERVRVAYCLSTALQYLHDNNIVYRDLKPENIGFDFNGDLRLFDFGLVRELQQKVRTTECTFLLTGGTGDPPYMAPEVALHEPYNEKCDVFSFCILLWQLLKVEEPFVGRLSGDSFYLQSVVEEGIRPKIESSWPGDIKQCLELGWDRDISKRQSMASIAEILQNEITEAIAS